MSAYRVRRQPANLYLVRERDRSRLRELASLLLGVFLLGGTLLVWTWIQLELRAVGGRVLRLERRIHDLNRTERQLELEASFLASPQRIDLRARAELGMTLPPPQRIIHIARP